VIESNELKYGQFSIKVRLGNTEINVSAPDKDFVLDESRHLIELFKLDNIVTHSSAVEIIQEEVTAPPEMSQARTMKPETLSEFFRRFASLQTHLDKILVFGYWCEIKQNQAHFMPEDILAKYKEAREAPPANVRRDLSSLVSKGFLLPPTKSDDGVLAYALSNTGIKEVESKMSQM
jgi:hypothetical protein